LNNNNWKVKLLKIGLKAADLDEFEINEFKLKKHFDECLPYCIEFSHHMHYIKATLVEMV